MAQHLAIHVKDQSRQRLALEVGLVRTAWVGQLFLGYVGDAVRPSQVGVVELRERGLGSLGKQVGRSFYRWAVKDAMCTCP